MGDEPVRDVLAFREKPDRATAEEFLARGNYLWNSGMFAYSVKTFNEELAQSSPDIAGPFSSLDASAFPLETRNNVRVPASLGRHRRSLREDRRRFGGLCGYGKEPPHQSGARHHGLE